MDYSSPTLLAGWISCVCLLGTMYCVFLSGIYYFCYYNPKHQGKYIVIDAEDEALSPNLPLTLKCTSMLALLLYCILGTAFVSIIFLIPTDYLSDYHESITVILSGVFVICKYFLYFYFIQKLQFTFFNTFYSLTMCSTMIMATLLCLEFGSLIAGQILEYNQYSLEYVNISIKNWNRVSIIAYFIFDGIFCCFIIYLYLVRFYGLTVTRVERHDYVPYERMFLAEESLALERASIGWKTNDRSNYHDYNSFGSPTSMADQSHYHRDEKHSMILTDMTRYSVCVFYGLIVNYIFSIYFLYKLWNNPSNFESMFWLFLCICGCVACLFNTLIIWCSWKFSFAMKFYYKFCCFCQRSFRLCCEALALRRKRYDTIHIQIGDSKPAKKPKKQPNSRMENDNKRNANSKTPLKYEAIMRASKSTYASVSEDDSL